MQTETTIVLIHSYSILHLRVDNNINLEAFLNTAEIRGHVLFSPRPFMLKSEKPLKEDNNGFFFAIELPK
jgi:hypothetical protein